MFFLTALVEEILLRGVLIELLLVKLSSRNSLLLSSVVFTGLHAQSYQSIPYATAVFILGIVLSFLYLHMRKKSRVAAIIYLSFIHCLIIIIGIKLSYI